MCTKFLSNSMCIYLSACHRHNRMLNVAYQCIKKKKSFLSKIKLKKKEKKN